MGGRKGEEKNNGREENTADLSGFIQLNRR